MSLLQNLRGVVRFEDFERDPDARRLAHAASVDDLRAIARRRLPAGVFDYVDGGAEDELTLAANAAAFRQTRFRPRVLRNVGAVDVSSALFGSPVQLPLVLAPTGFTRLVHPEGERAVARAAANAGVPFTLSTLSTCSIEEVRAVSEGRLWFQVYAWRDRGLVKEMVDRAAAARYEALVLTVDTAVLGRRERDVRRGFALPPALGPRTFLDGALHPQWTWRFLRNDPIRFANVLGRDVGDAATPVTMSEYISTQFDPALAWADVEWLQAIWDGPIVLKGIQTEADASIAADLGVTAVALSNHGGRQLDGAPAPFSLVAPVADAGRPRGHHLRRRPSARQRHREGAGGRRDGLHGGPRLSLRARGGRRARGGPPALVVARRHGPQHDPPRCGGRRGARPFAHRSRSPGMSPLPARMRSGAPDAGTTARATMHRP
jgi:L-lactate dehydrogenase (cytochrome)